MTDVTDEPAAGPADAAPSSDPGALAARDPAAAVVAGDAPSSEPAPAPGAAPQPGAPLVGELRRAPRSALLTFVLGATGVLAVGQVLGVVGRFTLGVKRPAQLEITPRGLRIAHRTLLLGRVIRERETLVPLGALLRITREVRFARAGLYAGLGALALGTYLGVGLIVDAARVPGGSPSLFAMGLGVILVGLVLDFALSTWSDSVKGRCQLVVVPVKGRTLCIGALAPAEADRALRAIAGELGIEARHPEAALPGPLQRLAGLFTPPGTTQAPAAPQAARPDPKATAAEQPPAPTPAAAPAPAAATKDAAPAPTPAAKDSGAATKDAAPAPAAAAKDPAPAPAAAAKDPAPAPVAAAPNAATAEAAAPQPAASPAAQATDEAAARKDDPASP